MKSLNVVIQEGIRGQQQGDRVVGMGSGSSKAEEQ